ncbi:MAG: putative peptidoglycan glycosyltransferase FtsW [Patescibacteria group bacterium]
MLLKPSKIGHRPDYFLMAVVFIITVFGLVMLSSASSEIGKAQFNDSYYYIKHQITRGLSFGVVGFLLGYLIYYQRWRKFALPLLIFGLIGLTLVFSGLGLEVRGSNRWVNLGPLSFQPGELMKLAFLVYLAAWLSNPKAERAKNFVEGLLPFMLISGLVAVLLLLQPATSTMVILLGAGLVMYFSSGAKFKYIAGAVALGILVLAVVIYATPYRRARIITFLNPAADTQGESYHINQALIAIGSGGLTGVGYGQSATKASYLPTPIDDSIFAVIAEELGFIGAAFVITLFAMLTIRLFWLAKNTRDNFGRLLLVGFGSIIALQSFTNMAAISGIVPLTGVPLPFISFGGTALAAFLTMSGMALNVSKYT